MANSRANYKLGAPMPQGVAEKIKALQTVFGDKSSATTDGSNRQEYILLQQSTPWIRMQSGVNLSQSKAEEYGLSAKEAGTTLAKRNILFGLNKRVEATDDKGKLSLQSYEPNNGDLPGYEQTSDFGIRPRPGITGMSIHSHNRFGSLRTAVVNFQCWSKEQIDALELLYMRPGYTVLLEWGHSKNLKVKPGGTPDGVADMDLGIDFYDSKYKSATKLRNDILEKRKDNHFGYDAIVGTIKNFSWKLRKDGGYDCSTSLVTAGDIIESFKANFFLTQGQIRQDIILELEEAREASNTDRLQFPLLHADEPQDTAPVLGPNLENLITNWYQQANQSLDELANYLDDGYLEQFKRQDGSIDNDRLAESLKDLAQSTILPTPAESLLQYIEGDNAPRVRQALSNLIRALEVVRPTDADTFGHGYQGHGYSITKSLSSRGGLEDIETLTGNDDSIINSQLVTPTDYPAAFEYHRITLQSKWPALVDFFFNEYDPSNPDAPYNGFGTDFSPNLELPEGGRAAFQIKFSERKALINEFVDACNTSWDATYGVGTIRENHHIQDKSDYYTWPLMTIYNILGNVVDKLSRIKENDTANGGSGTQLWFCDTTNVGDSRGTGLLLDDFDESEEGGHYGGYRKIAQFWGRRQRVNAYYSPNVLWNSKLQDRWYSAIGIASDVTAGYENIPNESIDPADSEAVDQSIFAIPSQIRKAGLQGIYSSGGLEYNLRRWHPNHVPSLFAEIKRRDYSSQVVHDGSTADEPYVYSTTRFLVMKWDGYDSELSTDPEDITAIDAETGETYRYHDPNDDYASKLHYYLRSKIENPYIRKYLRGSFSGRNFQSVFTYRELPEWVETTSTILGSRYTKVHGQLADLLGGRFQSDQNLELRNYVYIRLQVLLALLNKHVLKGDDEYFFEFQTEYVTGRAPEYFTFDDHISTDPRKCILPHTLPDVLNEALLPDRKNDRTPTILNIELSINYILDTLNRYLESDGRAPMLGFIQSILDGISRVSGGQNDFQLQYMEDDSVFHVVDRRQLDIRTNAKGLKKDALINVYGLDTIVKDVDLVSKITPKMSSMIAISAQDSPYTSQDEATGFNGINRGITDLVYTERYDIEQESTGEKQETDYKKLREALQSQIAGVITHLGMYYVKCLVPRHSTDTQAGMYENYCKFLFGASTRLQNGGRSSYNFIIPFELQLTTYGISGLRVMDSFAINEDLLPRTYGGGNGQDIGFLVTGIEHQLDRGGWSTRIKSQIFNIDDTSPPVKTYFNLQKSITNSVGHLGSGGSQTYAPPGPVATQGSGVDRLKFLIGSKESRNRYEVANTSGGGNGIRIFYSNTTIMDKTIRDLLDNYATQDKLNQDGSVNKDRVFAMGRMQITPSVLESALTNSYVIGKGVTGNSLFNETTQEVLFDYLIYEKRPDLGNYVLGNNTGDKADMEAAINAMGYEWAAYPVLTHSDGDFAVDLEDRPKWRKTNYPDVGGNPAESQYTVAQIADILHRVRTEITRNTPPYEPPPPA